MGVFHEVQLRALLHQLTATCVNLKYRQWLLRRGLPLDTAWLDAKSAHQADLTAAMIKLLHMAALLKYITQYREMAQSRLA